MTRLWVVENNFGGIWHIEKTGYDDPKIFFRKRDANQEASFERRGWNCQVKFRVVEYVRRKK